MSPAAALSEDLQGQIAAGCRSLQLAVSTAALAQLADYVGLLAKWSKVYNLTAVRQPQRMVTRHLLDSLAVVPFLIEGSLLDVGTGAGLPGVPIVRPSPS